MQTSSTNSDIPAEVKRAVAQVWPETMRRERVTDYLRAVYDIDIGARALERWPIRNAKVGRVTLYRREDVDAFIRERFARGRARNAAA